MAGRQRGNTIIISAILVLALTVAALTVSRVLTSFSEQQGPARQFLGEQAYAVCLSAIASFSTSPVSTGTPEIFNFSIPYASTSPAVTVIAPVVVTAPGSITPNTAYSVTATVSLPADWTEATVSETVQALICNGAPAGTPPCPDAFAVVNR